MRRRRQRPGRRVRRPGLVSATSLLLTAATAAVLAFSLPAVAAPPIPAAAPAGPVLTSVALSTSTVSISGVDTVTVTATVTTTGETLECHASDVDGYVLLTRTSTRVWDRSATRALLAGTSCVSDTDGVRTRKADILVPSTADGPWRVSAVNITNGYSLDPRAFGQPDATLTVTGTHRPRLRISMQPQPLVYPARDVKVTVQATYDDTRAPVTTRWIGITDNGGWIGWCGSCPANTDSNGRLVQRLRLTDGLRLITKMPLSAEAPYDLQPTYSELAVPVVAQPALTVAPAKHVMPHGVNVDVNGRAVAVLVQAWYFRPRIKVGLQRLVGRHWRTVSQGAVRPNGRFTLVATPPKGRNVYRVGLPAQQDIAAATSRAFVIRGI